MQSLTNLILLIGCVQDGGIRLLIYGQMAHTLVPKKGASCLVSLAVCIELLGDFMPKFFMCKQIKSRPKTTILGNFWTWTLRIRRVGVAFDDRALFHETGYFEQSLRLWEFTERIWEKHSIQGLPFRQRTPSMVFHPATPKPRPCEKERQDSVYHDRRPQQGSDPFATDADVSEIGCRQSAVDQHADQRRARPAGDP